MGCTGYFRRDLCLSMIAAMTTWSCGTFRHSKETAADLIILGGRIATMEPSRPWVEALAIYGNRIVTIGSPEAVMPLRGPTTQIIDLQGGSAVPGLCDAHAHLQGLGQQMETVDLRGATSVEEVVKRLRRQAPSEGWIFGRGWDQNLWPDTSMPMHHALTAAFPQRPVWLTRIDGHAGWGNRRLLELAKIDRHTSAPRGGEIVRDEQGEPTGVLIDTAMELVNLPAVSDQDIERWILRAQAEVLSLGITSIHEMGISKQADQVLRRLSTQGKLQIRIYGYADRDWFTQDLITRSAKSFQTTPHYQLKGVKLFIDGALGSRGAALLTSYSDRPDHRGQLQYTAKQLAEIVSLASQNGWQVASHAIGDHAIRLILSVYRQVSTAKLPRLRIEHVQIIDSADIEDLAQSRVVASMQPTHATSDMPWVEARIGKKRLQGAYAWRSLLERGVPLAFGSDTPIEKPNVTHGLYAAITRQDEYGQPEGGWLPEQRLELQEALHGFTLGAAYAVAEEHHLGMLIPGYLADITCFFGDLWRLSPLQLRTAAVRATIVNGKQVWEQIIPR